MCKCRGFFGIFFIGVISSICLIYYGNKKFEKENLSIGIFFIYISFVQFFEYLIWIDLDNKMGINKIISIILLLILFSQPIILYIIKSFIFKQSNFFVNIFIAVYVFLYFLIYNSYLKHEKLITGVKNKYLHWKWDKYNIPFLYLMFFTIAIFLYSNFYYSLLFFILGLFLLFISFKISFIEHNSIWCLLSAYIPIYMLIGSYLL